MTIEIDIDYDNDVFLSNNKRMRTRIHWQEDGYPSPSPSNAGNPIFRFSEFGVAQVSGQSEWETTDATDAYGNLVGQLLRAYAQVNYDTDDLRALVGDMGGKVYVIDSFTNGTYVAVMLPEFAEEWGVTDLRPSLGAWGHYLLGEVFSVVTDRFDEDRWDWELGVDCSLDLYGRPAAEKYARDAIEEINYECKAEGH